MPIADIKPGSHVLARVVWAGGLNPEYRWVGGYKFLSEHNGLARLEIQHGTFKGSVVKYHTADVKPFERA